MKEGVLSNIFLLFFFNVIKRSISMVKLFLFKEDGGFEGIEIKWGFEEILKLE